jgi:hypothetical protein
VAVAMQAIERFRRQSGESSDPPLIPHVPGSWPEP